MVKKLSVELLDEKGNMIRQWTEATKAELLDFEADVNRYVKITTKDGGKIFVMVSFNNTFIIEERYEEQ